MVGVSILAYAIIEGSRFKACGLAVEGLLAFNVQPCYLPRMGVWNGSYTSTLRVPSAEAPKKQYQNRRVQTCVLKPLDKPPENMLNRWSLVWGSGALGLSSQDLEHALGFLVRPGFQFDGSSSNEASRQKMQTGNSRRLHFRLHTAPSRIRVVYTPTPRKSS